ncbi:MAG: 3-isopropylmalate dehydrogenase [Lachnospiraceae bacterium]|jgi:3-isopropylmalate dehydrogenase|nr:3-isopropylmalate dehydrogenase [Lachnospiraceae bacterium]MCH4070094.1 3-isopropylmalate dehydrogenase [Lachnospiraceae bacterium]MCH4108554.1 3-isopropylmalate dehydrogenase [Lachnospiraceae bacterium]MCI1302673.1 3-isopropylmalate dehydrogenase [Lachnospiraceae bacterium]MCI1331857.1 3-isopropylmalate dehydrogenase [Lachnospiraceae bacterium]
MAEKTITLIPGDGIGPEIVAEAVRVLDAVADKYGHKFSYKKILMGGCSIDAYGVPLTDEAIATAKSSDAVLLGAVGGKVGNSRWYDVAPNLRPEAGLLKIRKSLGLFANVRPAYLYPELADACPLKQSHSGDSFDLVIMRELTGGLYFGERHTEVVNGLRTATDTLVYNEEEIRRIAVRAFEVAERRRKKVTSVDKANVLDSSRLWRAVVHEVAKDYPDVEEEDMLVDNCAMQLVHDPGQFDVILTENMFGDILSDEASMITGSIGMLPSASLCASKLGLYEPSHGSAPDIAGLGVANPLATILSAAMLLRYSFDMDAEADDVEEAVKKVLKDGFRTPDICREGDKKVSTSGMGDAVIAAL